VKDQLDFALTVIKRDYNTNDRLKFILSFIRRDNDLNKNKVSDSNTYRLKNEERTKNG